MDTALTPGKCEARRLEVASVVELKDNALQGLTSAQQAFARHVHGGLSYSDAYRLAYPERKEGRGLKEAAAYMANLPLVQAKLRELRLAAEQPTTLAPTITREFVLEGIKEIATHPDAKLSTRLQAYIALGKTYAAPVFKEPEQSDAKPISTEDMDKRILELLRAGMATIDGVARDVTLPVVNEKPANRKRKPRT